jgi:hypothetical protein
MNALTPAADFLLGVADENIKLCKCPPHIPLRRYALTIRPHPVTVASFQIVKLPYQSGALAFQLFELIGNCNRHFVRGPISPPTNEERPSAAGMPCTKLSRPWLIQPKR